MTKTKPARPPHRRHQIAQVNVRLTPEEENDLEYYASLHASLQPGPTPQTNKTAFIKAAIYHYGEHLDTSAA